MAENALTKVARIAAGSAMGALVKDKDGNDKVIKPTGDGNNLDFRDVIIGGGGSDSGGGTDQNHPAASADYYAGSLADGEITERYLLYQRDESVAEKAGSQTVTLLRDVGSTFNMAGDGATFLIHLQRTAMTKGAKGAVTDIELNYDPKNVAKDGYFTTTSPYPVYIKSLDLATREKLTIPINGIGESLSGKNVKAPQLNVIFNGNGTLTFESMTGYDNDGDSAGATGANYDVVVDVIATFSTQKAVAQLPASINLFYGNANGDIALTGASKFYENSMDGIEVTFDNTAKATQAMPKGIFSDGSYFVKVDFSTAGISKVRIPKEYLVPGVTYDFGKGFYANSNEVQVYGAANTSSPYWTSSHSDKPGKYFINYLSVTIAKISSESVNINFQFTLKWSQGGDISTAKSSSVPFQANVIKVTPYKN